MKCTHTYYMKRSSTFGLCNLFVASSQMAFLSLSSHSVFLIIFKFCRQTFFFLPKKSEQFSAFFSYFLLLILHARNPHAMSSFFALALCLSILFKLLAHICALFIVPFVSFIFGIHISITKITRTQQYKCILYTHAHIY